MIGGDADAVERLDPIFASLAPGVEAAPRTPGRSGEPSRAERGYLHCGPSGAGHFVKMVHNGIEYGLMAAYAEGFNVFKHADAGAVDRPVDAETTPLRDPERYRYEFPLDDIAEVWRRGSVVASWLLDLTAAALHERARPRWLRRPRVRLRRGTLDVDRRDRVHDAHARAHRRALRAVREPGRGRFRGQGALRDAGAVRRSRGRRPRCPTEARVSGAGALRRARALRHHRGPRLSEDDPRAPGDGAPGEPRGAGGRCRAVRLEQGTPRGADAGQPRGARRRRRGGVREAHRPSPLRGRRLHRSRDVRAGCAMRSGTRSARCTTSRSLRRCSRPWSSTSMRSGAPPVRGSWWRSRSGATCDRPRS